MAYKAAPSHSNSAYASLSFLIPKMGATLGVTTKESREGILIRLINQGAAIKSETKHLGTAASKTHKYSG